MYMPGEILSGDEHALFAPFLKACKAYPKRIAVVDSQSAVSYEELSERVGKAAALLMSLGVTRGERVAIVIDRSIGSIVAILATLIAGGVYVPFDPRWPHARKRHILEAIHARVAVLPHADAELAPLCGHALFEDALQAQIDQTGATAKPPAPSRTDPAYILFTSGTSGIPKGVVVSHGAARHFTDWTVREFQLSPDDRIAGVSSFTFDLSIFDIFSTLSSGAALYLYDHRKAVLSSALAKFLERHEISIVYTVPTTLALLAARGGLHQHPMRGLRAVLFAGEPFAYESFQRLRAALPPSIEYFNLYGPTETNVCAFHRIDGNENPVAGIPIGKPIPATRLTLVASKEAEAYGPGAGELHVFGPTLMTEYWNGGAENAPYWIKDPLTGEVGYRTGDACRMDGAGNLFFLGRIDNQLKVNGFRIEAEEIENTLMREESVIQCAVAAVTQPGADVQQLVAFIVPERPGSPAELSKRLIDACRSALPANLCPHHIMFLESLPTKVSGKTDRSTLVELYIGRRKRSDEIGESA